MAISESEKKADEMRLTDVISNVKRWEAITEAKKVGDVGTVQQYATVRGWEESPVGQQAVKEAKVEAAKIVYEKTPEEVKTEIEAKKLETERQKLKLGVPVVSAYAPPTVVGIAKPFTKEEIAEAKKLKLQYIPITYFKEEIIPKLEKAKEKVAAAYQKIYYAYKPEEKVAKERITEVYSNYETGVKEYNKNVNEIDKKIEKLDEDINKYEKTILKFNEKYGGKELPEEEYNIAVKEQENLIKEEEKLTRNQEKIKTEVKELEDSEKFWNEFKEKIKDVEEREMLKAKAISIPKKVLTSFSIGVITAPISIAGLALTAVTKPIEIVKGLGELPKEIIKRPLEIIPEMIGGAIVVTGAIGIVKSAIAKAGAIKVTPKISQSFSVSEATKVGTTPEGLTMWKTTGTVKTKLINPKTGKIISTMKTQTISDTITSSTKSGAIKSFSESWATSLKTSDIRLITGKTPTVKLKVGLTKAKGTMTLSPTEVKKLYTGYGEYGIREMGKIEVLAKPSKVVTKIRITPGKEFEALSNIWAKEIGIGKAVKAVVTPKKAVAITGKEYKYMYKSLTDIYGKEGAKAIIKAREVGFAKAFVPKELIVKFKEPFKPPIVKAKLPPKPIVIKPTVKPIDMTTQLQQIFGLPEEAVAKVGAAQISKAIAKTITGEPKPIVIPKVVKVSPIIKTAQVLAPVVAVAEMTKLQERERQMNIQRLNQALGLEQITREKQLQIQKMAVTPIQAQKLQQKQIQTQMQKLAQITAPIVPTPVPVIPIPITPPIIFPMFKPKETPAERKRRKIEEKKAREQARAYAASVAAVSLGIYAPRKKLPKRVTGLEIRPIEETAYAKQLKKIFI